MLFEDFSEGAETRWRYLSDQVMGGVSQGGAALAQEDATYFAQLSGRVSTANNGGFIQLRRDLDDMLSANVTGLRLRVRGSNGPYFVHIRTNKTQRPWHYYQASFPVSETWNDVNLNWNSFSAKGRGIPDSFTPDQIVSIGLVAYGRDHQADLDIQIITAIARLDSPPQLHHTALVPRPSRVGHLPYVSGPK